MKRIKHLSTKHNSLRFAARNASANVSTSCMDELNSYIAQKKWVNLRSALYTSSAEKTIQKDENNQFLLLACRNGAPIEIIKILVSIKPELLQEKDTEFEQTPLHLVCCLKSVTKEVSRVIAYLSKSYEDAMIIPDKHGNTPLHLMCKNLCKSPHFVAAMNILCKIIMEVTSL